MGPRSDEGTAREFATLFLEGSVAAAVDLLDEEGRTAVVDSFPEEFREEGMDAGDALDAYRRGLHGQYGDADGVADVSASDGEATVELAFEDGTETATVAVEDGAAAGFSFDTEYEAPAYADEAAFDERAVTVDAGDVTLDGVLAVPTGTGPFPGVVLVHGAGIHDPDGTAGASKILRDLAWGFASEGVATLRYEKRLADHEVPDEDHTLDTVVVDDAVAALDELGAADEVRADALFVAGHSQGGMCAPRIADRHGDLAGVVVLDARADSTLDPDDLAPLRYELDPEGDLDEEDEAELERQRETVRRIAEGEFDDDETMWGRPGTWHRSVRRYDPAATASGLDAPVYVAKTGRADEETQADLADWLREGFETWQAVDLPDGSRVVFYEDADHYLQEGHPPADPLALHFGGNVAGGVVSDLVAWVRDAASGSGEP